MRGSLGNDRNKADRSTAQHNSKSSVSEIGKYDPNIGLLSILHSKVKTLAKDPELEYKSSRWMNSDGRTISTCLVYDPVQVEVQVENPMRKQAVTSIIKIVIYKDRALLPDNKVKEESRILSLLPLSTGTISASFTPTEESGYHYTILIEGNQAYSQPRHSPPRLFASRRESTLILDEPSGGVPAGSTLTLTGRLLSTDTGEAIDGAKIYIYDVRHMRRDSLISSGITGNDGIFNIGKIAKKMHWWDGTAEIYAKFKGDDVYKLSTSNPRSISVSQMRRKIGNQPRLIQTA